MAKRIHDSDSEDGEEQVSPEQSPNQKRSRVSEAGPSNTARDTYYGADGEALADEPMIGDDDDEPSEEEDEEEVKQRTENVERMRRNTKANGVSKILLYCYVSVSYTDCLYIIYSLLLNLESLIE